MHMKVQTVSTTVPWNWIEVMIKIMLDFESFEICLLQQLPNGVYVSHWYYLETHSGCSAEREKVAGHPVSNF